MMGPGRGARRDGGSRRPARRQCRDLFALQPGDNPVLLISAGVGATPVLAMLHALADAASGRDVWWLHGARNRAEEPFAEELRSLLAALARGHRHVYYSRRCPR